MLNLFQNYVHFFMSYGICNISIVPIYKEPSLSSVLVSQLLFGEDFEIRETYNSWYRIQTTFDREEGWIPLRMIGEISDDHFNKLNSQEYCILNQPLSIMKEVDSEGFFIITGGSRIGKPDKKIFVFNGKTYEMENDFLSKKKSLRDAIVDYSTAYLNVPYFHGGRSAMGIDCSGFVQVIFKMAGITLPRHSAYQSECGTAHHFLQDSKPGDLAFFGDEDGKINHVGILLSPKYIIHSSGKVRIDSIDQQGIYNSEQKRHSHNLRIIKSIQ